MKRPSIFLTFISAAAVAAFALSSILANDPVADAIERGLPRTAIRALEPIIERALAEGSYPEAAAAIAQKIVLEGAIQGHHADERIRRMQEVLETVPPEVRPILHTLQAHWYWTYFQQNRWRFMQRTTTGEPPGDDFTTWDLARLYAEIDRQFSLALEARDFLRATPVTDWEPLLTTGTVPDRYRPTLYDFIVHEALEFYTSGEQAGAKPQDDFEISAEDPVFAPVDEFLAWELPEEAADSPKAKAVRLYQELLHFHRDQPEPFADADLGRLVFAKNTAIGPAVEERFISAMRSFIDEWSENEVAAMALFQLARALQGQDELAEAHAIARRAVTAFPKSPGARMAQNVIREIESKSARIETEGVWNDPPPTIDVTYRNVDHVYFRAVRYDWDQLLDAEREVRHLSRTKQAEFLRLRPAAVWDHRLPPTSDFQERTESLPVPVVDQLKPGFYIILASHDRRFQQKDNQIALAPVWVSNLSLVVWPRADRLDGVVVDARSGEPIDGAKVAIREITHPGRPTVSPVTVSTGSDGFFSRKWETNHTRFVVKASHDGDSVATLPDSFFSRSHRTSTREQTVLFTDRSIYRPGQTIQYKGILLRTDPEENNYEVIDRRRVTVLFYDANGQVIERQQHQSNAYGSFSGSFTAPHDRLTGQMRIAVNRPNGSAFVRVEEYKRPRFSVTLDAPSEAPRLDEEITVSGKAAAYTGAPVDGATVAYRVVRETRGPWWWWGGRGGFPFHGTTQEIAQGTAVSAVDGSFSITFSARPDRSVPEADEPIFVFRIYADVTDTAGETRSTQRTVSAGYTALQAILELDPWQTPDRPVNLQVKTRSLDDEPERAAGSLAIYRLQEPDRIHRKRPESDPGDWRRPGPPPEDDLSDPANWPNGERLTERPFTTGPEGEASANFKLPAGFYRAVIETTDRFGKPVTGEQLIHVIAPDEERFETPVPHFFQPEKETVEPGETFRALWGTGYDRGRALVEIEHRQQIIRRFWTDPDHTQSLIEIDVTEEMRGGFNLSLTFVRENRIHTEVLPVKVPWSNQRLDIRWERFTSRLEPNIRETWTAVIQGSDAGPAAAEMVATLYDASLDAFQPHRWAEWQPLFFHHPAPGQPRHVNYRRSFGIVHHGWQVEYAHPQLLYRSFATNFLPRGAVFLRESPRRARAASGMALDATVQMESLAMADKAAPAESEAAGEPAPNLTTVAPRRNLQETAFFFPHLETDEAGTVRLTFTMPETLTEWRFLGFAHDRNLRWGMLEGEAVSAKDLMVQPNPPRFVREGDEIEFSVTVTNGSDRPQEGTVRLGFTDALTELPADERLGLHSPDQTFSIPANESRSFHWRLTVPDSLPVLIYRAVAVAGQLSDGEEGYLPVLSRRMLVREALPLPIRGPGEREFEFEKLIRSGESDTLHHQSLTIQMVSNPAWYAVLALPYLMESSHGSTEQTFNRLYANALGRHIANSNPKIRGTFDLWKNIPALESPLEKNEELKNVLLQETPWVRQAQSESQARRNIGILFDENRLNSEIARTVRRLGEEQFPDGGWPWFAGGPANEFMTLYITTGFGRVRHLGVDVPMEPALRSIDYLDRWIDRLYREFKDGEKENFHLSPSIALYLYGRSFFLEDHPIAREHRTAVDYFLRRGKENWPRLRHRQSQAHLALALHRFGDAETPAAILDSIREHAVHDEEMGMFWRDLERSWWWYRAPIETQALMIEAFAEIAADWESVEECKVWLLKQKQTQDWKTTKATADAVYALILRGTDLLASRELVHVSLGQGQSSREITPAVGSGETEPGTGFYEVRIVGPEVDPEHGYITVRKADEGVAWGGAHWQYLEDLEKITPHQATPLQLKKQVFRKVPSSRGPVLETVEGALNVGDELVVRIELRSDRDMEYLHLKDSRGAGLEPLNVLSGYRYQDGLAYYESTRDTASHFFIDYLPRGTYVFEYSTRVFHRGVYGTGIAEIQSMYAPEFSSHSESISLQVK